MTRCDKLVATHSAIVCAKSVDTRDAEIAAAKIGFQSAFPRGKTGVFTLKPNVKTDDDFLAALPAKLPLTSPLGIEGSDMSLDQINDYWLEWPHERNFDAALIVWPDAHALVAGDPRFFYEQVRGLLYVSNQLHVAGLTALRFVLISKTTISLASLDAQRIELFGMPSYWKKKNAPKTMAELVTVLSL